MSVLSYGNEHIRVVYSRTFVEEIIVSTTKIGRKVTAVTRVECSCQDGSVVQGRQPEFSDCPLCTTKPFARPQLVNVLSTTRTGYIRNI